MDEDPVMQHDMLAVESAQLLRNHIQGLMEEATKAEIRETVCVTLDLPHAKIVHAGPG